MQYRLLKSTGAIADGQIPSAPNGAFDAESLVASWTPNVRPVRRAPEERVLKNLLERQIDPAVLSLVPEAIVRENCCLPVELRGEKLQIAVVDASDIALADRLRFLLAHDVELVRASRPDILRAILRNYGAARAHSVDSMLAEFTDAELDLEACEGDRADAARGRAKSLAVSGMTSAAVRHSGSSLPGFSKALATQDFATGGGYRGSRAGGSGMFFYTVPDGQRVLMTCRDGTVSVLTGPRRVFSWFREFEPMARHVAHPGEFLIVRHLDGTEQHLPGPAEVWFDPRIHGSVTREESLQIAAKEAVVVYTRESAADDAATTRRVVTGPTMFVPQPGEWLHTFAWHASKGGSQGVQKVPRGLVFQKIWLMPDQMYHDVPDVRTADDAVLTIRLMIFFELVDIQRMLDATHDPIGDFVNAATADAVEFVGRHDFESFKRNTARLNDIATYSTLTARASQCGYRITNVVYRGYGAADSLQQMHNQAIEARTRLQLERATEQQAQELENFKLESQMARASRRRSEQADEVQHDLEMTRRRSEAELTNQEHQQRFLREQREANARLQDDVRRRSDAVEREHLNSLRELGVNLTEYLTQGRADRVIELRGNGVSPHVHLNQNNGQSTDE